MTETGYYDSNDLNELYGLKKSSVERLVKSGILTEHKVGEKVLFKKSQVMTASLGDLLTLSEEREFLRSITGLNSVKSRDQFIRIHYFLIQSISKQYENRGKTQGELCSIGIAALVTSLERFKFDPNERFNVHAAKCIKKEIESALNLQQGNDRKQDEPKSNLRTAPKLAQKTQQADKPNEALERLKAIKDQSPRQLYSQLEQMGYVGQEEARRKLCLMAYRHVRRLKDYYLNRIPLGDLPPKTTVLILRMEGLSGFIRVFTHWQNLIGKLNRSFSVLPIH